MLSGSFVGGVQSLRQAEMSLARLHVLPPPDTAESEDLLEYVNDLGSHDDSLVD